MPVQQLHHPRGSCLFESWARAQCLVVASTSRCQTPRGHVCFRVPPTETRAGNKKQGKGQKLSTTRGPEGRERKGRKINNSGRNQRGERREKRENKRKLILGWGEGRRPCKGSGRGQQWEVRRRLGVSGRMSHGQQICAGPCITCVRKERNLDANAKYFF